MIQILGIIANIAQIVSVVWVLFLGAKTIPDLLKGKITRQAVRWPAMGIFVLIVVVIAANVGLPSLHRALSTTTNTSNSNPYPPGKGKLVLNDPLDGNSTYGWANFDSDIGSACRFINGTYHAIASNGSTAGYSFPPDGGNYCMADLGFSNFTFEVQESIASGECGGITSRAGDFAICQDGSYTFDLFKDKSIETGQWSENAYNGAVHPGLAHPNLLAIVANGKNVDFYINHQKIMSFVNKGPDEGKIGFFALNGSNGSDVVFTNVRVWVL